MPVRVMPSRLIAPPSTTKVAGFSSVACSPSTVTTSCWITPSMCAGCGGAKRTSASPAIRPSTGSSTPARSCASRCHESTPKPSFPRNSPLLRRRSPVSLQTCGRDSSRRTPCASSSTTPRAPLALVTSSRPAGLSNGKAPCSVQSRAPPAIRASGGEIASRPNPESVASTTASRRARSILAEAVNGPTATREALTMPSATVTSPLPSPNGTPATVTPARWSAASALGESRVPATLPVKLTRPASGACTPPQATIRASGTPRPENFNSSPPPLPYRNTPRAVTRPGPT